MFVISEICGLLKVSSRILTPEWWWSSYGVALCCMVFVLVVVFSVAHTHTGRKDDSFPVSVVSRIQWCVSNRVVGTSTVIIFF